MKRLTINDVAKASLRTGKRAYLSLAIGIFLSIFLITSICTCALGVVAASDERYAQKYGYEDFILFDDPTYTDAELMESGMFDRVGHTYITARVTDAMQYMGYYDSEGGALINRRLWDGRMPEKAGEIAIERAYLETLRSEIKVGDSISIRLTAIDGAEETREYTLVGILRDQTGFMNFSSYSHLSTGKLLVMPSLIVHEEEPGFATGRTVLHRLLTANPLLTQYQVMLAWCEKTCIYALHGGQMIDFPIALYFDMETAYLMTGLIMLGLSLLTACGVGISQALEGRVAQRREEIGMLRAVGATKRQIRRIFGREAWILALVLAPLSVAAGCGFSFLASLAVPDMLLFVFDLRILLMVAAFSFLCILLSASLPLKRAAHIMPMSVIRDTELLRKSKSIKAKKRFSAPRLISVRQLKLHPTRQIGAAFLTAIMLICMIIGINYALPQLSKVVDDSYAFDIGDPWGWIPVDFADAMPRTALTVQDVRQIAALDHVAYAGARWSTQVNLIMEMGETAPEYFRYSWENDQLYPEEASKYVLEEYEIVRELLDIERGKEVVTYNLIVLDDSQMSRLERYVESGKIDMAAVNAGREVIAYAPDIWLEISYDENGKENGYGSYSGDEREGKYYQWNKKVENDAFHAGQEMDIVQMYLYADEAEQYSQSDEDFERKVYSAAHRNEASVTVGAVLMGGSLNDLDVDVRGGMITSVAGAQAMGMELGAPYVNIGLNGEVDQETETYLQERIEAIAARGEGTSVFNQMAWYRENQQMFRNMLLVFLCMTLVFFAVSVSIIAGNVGRRVRAESRMIGTLRAVGADAKAVAGCYIGQIVMSVALGTSFALALYGVFLLGIADSYTFYDLSPYIPHTLISVLLVSTGCYFCCRQSLNMSLRSVMKKSIIENIREL